MADSLQHAVALAWALFAVDAVETVDIQQHQRALAAWVAPLLHADLAPQVSRIRQLRDAVEGAVLAEQTLALGQVVVEHELLVAPVIDASREHQHPKRHQGLE